MRRSIQSLLTIILGFILAGTAAAQSVVPVNAASYVNPALPNGSIARGSMFIAFGAGLGPASIQVPNPFPFPSTLAGTTIDVTVGSVTKRCFMVYTSAGQIAGILPSDTPIGTGTMTVRFNNVVAGTGPVKVVANSFGIFTINQQGFGPAVATDPLAASAVYTTINSANPGDFVDIWGTGLGASLNANDDGLPQTGNLLAAGAVKVYVANVEQPVLYAGRSGCCSAIDQIRIAAPNMSGCFLPVVVTVNGVPSNYATVSIASSGLVCTPDPVFGGPNFSQLQNGGTFETGFISLSRSRLSFDVGLLAPQQSFDLTTDIVAANYQRITLNAQQVSSYAPAAVSSVGSCVVFRYTGESAEFPDATPAVPLDAGPQLTINGPGGSSTVPKTAPGSYSKSFSTNPFPLLSPERQQSAPYFKPGQTTVSAPGGADVQSHNASIVVPQAFQWLNKPDSGDVINRSQGKQITYSASGFDYVYIFGSSALNVDDDAVGAAFFCAADAAAGSFTIPAPILLSLPDSPLIEGTPTGILSVGGYVADTFTATDLDQRSIIYSDTDLTTVDYN